MSAPPLVFSAEKTWQIRIRQHRFRTVVAAQARITPDHLKRIETGLCLPSVRVLPRLAAALGVEIGELFEVAP